MLTNWKTISNSIKRLKKLTMDLKEEQTGFTKKENLKMMFYSFKKINTILN